MWDPNKAGLWGVNSRLVGLYLKSILMASGLLSLGNGKPGRGSLSRFSKVPNAKASEHTHTNKKQKNMLNTAGSLERAAWAFQPLTWGHSRQSQWMPKARGPARCKTLCKAQGKHDSCAQILTVKIETREKTAHNTNTRQSETRVTEVTEVPTWIIERSEHTPLRGPGRPWQSHRARLWQIGKIWKNEANRNFRWKEEAVRG